MHRNPAILMTIFLGVALVTSCAPAAPPSPTAAPKSASTTAPATQPTVVPAAKPADKPADAAAKEAPKPAPKAAPGYKLIASHGEIVEKAKQEGQLRALTSLDEDTVKAVKAGFTKKYPFINFDLQVITGSKEQQKFVLELKAGTTGEWDSLYLTSDLYPEYLPFLEKYDLLAMAEQGVLKIPPKAVDPNNRNTVSTGTVMAASSFNPSLLSRDKAPKTWEDFLKPEFKGRKFVADIEPDNLAPLWALKGEQWAMDFAKKIAAQEPIWARGDTRAITALAAGEYPLHFASNYHSAMRVKAKAADALDVIVLEPVPVRLTEIVAVQKGAKHPHAALLYYEYLLSPEAQKVLDEIEPLKSSIYVPGGRLEEVTRGKKIALLDWASVNKRGEWVEKLMSAYGFPKAEIKSD